MFNMVLAYHKEKETKKICLKKGDARRRHPWKTGLTVEAENHLTGIFPRTDDGTAIGDAFLLAGRNKIVGIGLGNFKNAGHIERSESIFLFGVEYDVFDDVLRIDEIEHLFHIDEETIPEKRFGLGIVVTHLDEFQIVIKVVEDIRNDVILFDLALEILTDVIAETILNRVEVIIEALT